jgi:hypothetical protein
MRVGMWAGEGYDLEKRVAGKCRFVGDALLCVVLWLCRIDGRDIDEE